jgi:hypothetical protein
LPKNASDGYNAGDCGPLFANEAPPHSRARRPAVYEKIWASSPSCDEPTNFVGLWPSNLRGTKFRLRQFWLRFSTVEEPGGRPFARKPQRAAAAVSQGHVLRNRRNSCLGCLLSIAPVAHGWPRAASPSPTSDGPQSAQRPVQILSIYLATVWHGRDRPFSGSDMARRSGCPSSIDCVPVCLLAHVRVALG